jgi:hypothetical protein
MSKVAMLSQPMGGKTPREIEEARSKAIDALGDMGYMVVNTLFTDEMYREFSRDRDVKNPPLMYLAESLKNMSLCDAVYFCPGWEGARGCRIERKAAEDYGIEVIDPGDAS